ncbi:MAG: GHKL domain-containing protein [Ruminococcus sp.]|nr:GHKL domain-containing protein [Ruminococcus sp.]
MNEQIMYIANLYLQLSIGVFIFTELGHPKRGFFFITTAWTALFYAVHRLFMLFETNAVEEVLQTTAKFLTYFFVLTFYRENIWQKLRMSIYFSVVAIISEPFTLLLTSLAFGVTPSEFYSQNHMNIVLMSGKMISIDLMLAMATVICMLVKRKEHNSSRTKGLWGILLFIMLHTVFIIAFFAANRSDISYQMVWTQMIFQLLLSIMIYLRYFNSKRALEFIRTEAELENAAIEAESNKRYYELAQNKYEAITSLQSHLCAQLEKADDMLSSDGTEEMASIIGDIRRKLDEVRVVNYCASNTVNSVLTIKLEDEAMASIDTEIDLRDCDSLPLDEYELCSIIVNMFDNAVHCCQKLPEGGDRYIRLKSRAKGGFFIVRCENPYADGMEAGDSPVREGHGYGLKILGKTCEKYNGEFTLRYSGGTAVATAAVSLEGALSD